MTSKNIGYHTRQWGNDSVKTTGGSFGKSGETDNSISQQTIERLVKSHFTVTVKPSGTPVFVDKEGREVNLYISVDARNTEAGKAALKAWNAANAKAWAAGEEAERIAQDEIDSLMENLSHEEIINRLKGA